MAHCYSTGKKVEAVISMHTTKEIKCSECGRMKCIYYCSACKKSFCTSDDCLMVNHGL